MASLKIQELSVEKKKKKSQLLFRMSGITQMTFNGKKMKISNTVKDKTRVVMDK